MIHLHLTAADLRRIRFAVSPLQETVASLRTLAASASGTHLHGAWRDRVRDRLSAGLSIGDLDLLTTLIRPTGYMPDFLSPPPRRRLASFPEALAQVAKSDPATVAWQLEHLAGHRVAQQGPGRADRLAVLRLLIARPDAGIGQVTEALKNYHRVAIAPDWPRVEALLHDDIAHRLHMLADGGIDRLMRDLHPLATFTDQTLRVVKYYEGHAHANGRGLILIPCAFAWPDVIVRTSEPGEFTITYSPRGLGRLWERHQSHGDALADVLGRTRAALLRQLDLPMSTTQAAGLLDLSAPTLSVHLQALRAAGLLTSRRDGRKVLYSRTLLGDQLLTAGSPAPSPRSGGGRVE